MREHFRKFPKKDRDTHQILDIEEYRNMMGGVEMDRVSYLRDHCAFSSRTTCVNYPVLSCDIWYQDEPRRCCQDKDKTTKIEEFFEIHRIPQACCSPMAMFNFDTSEVADRANNDRSQAYEASLFYEHLHTKPPPSRWRIDRPLVNLIRMILFHHKMHHHPKMTCPA